MVFVAMDVFNIMAVAINIFDDIVGLVWCNCVYLKCRWNIFNVFCLQTIEISWARDCALLHLTHLIHHTILQCIN